MSVGKGNRDKKVTVPIISASSPQMLISRDNTGFNNADLGYLGK
jgi:hypothetical protein